MDWLFKDPGIEGPRTMRFKLYAQCISLPEVKMIKTNSIILILLLMGRTGTNLENEGVIPGLCERQDWSVVSRAFCRH